MGSISKVWALLGVGLTGCLIAGFANAYMQAERLWPCSLAHDAGFLGALNTGAVAAFLAVAFRRKTKWRTRMLATGLLFGSFALSAGFVVIVIATR